jgi:hypothetical protein
MVFPDCELGCVFAYYSPPKGDKYPEPKALPAFTKKAALWLKPDKTNKSSIKLFI